MKFSDSPNRSLFRSSCRSRKSLTHIWKMMVPTDRYQTSRTSKPGIHEMINAGTAKVFAFPPASSIARRTGADECPASAMAKEFGWPFMWFGSAPRESNVLTASNDSGRCHDCLTAKSSNVVPSFSAAFKSGTLFAATRIASESFFTILCVTANTAARLMRIAAAGTNQHETTKDD